MSSASAPAKIILFGEHSVVYGRPALAAPLTNLRARATITEVDTNDVVIESKNTGHVISLRDASPDHPLAAIVRLGLKALDVSQPAGLRIEVDSDIPIASGLGSGAAVSIAILRGLGTHLGRPLEAAEQSALAFEVEQIYHGTPSGIDNTVIAYEQPVYFVRDQPMERLSLGAPLSLLVADSGIPSSTLQAVADVRAAWEAETDKMEQIFDEIAGIVEEARQAIKSGKLESIGDLMLRNHDLLGEMGVSHPALDRLVYAACEAGASGAKLSGAGQGGNITAAVRADSVGAVSRALEHAGAKLVLATEISS